MSITCTTPFIPCISISDATILLTLSLGSVIVNTVASISNSSILIALTVVVVNSEERTLSANTCVLKTASTNAGSKSPREVLPVSSNSSNKAANAPSVGAKTVNGPLVESENSGIKFGEGFCESADCKAATKFESAGFAKAKSVIVGNPITASTIWTVPLEALISAPPFVTSEIPLNTTPLEVL